MRVCAYGHTHAHQGHCSASYSAQPGCQWHGNAWWPSQVQQLDAGPQARSCQWHSERTTHIRLDTGPRAHIYVHAYARARARRLLRDLDLARRVAAGPHTQHGAPWRMRELRARSRQATPHTARGHFRERPSGLSQCWPARCRRDLPRITAGPPWLTQVHTRLQPLRSVIAVMPTMAAVKVHSMTMDAYVHQCRID